MGEDSEKRPSSYGCYRDFPGVGAPSLVTEQSSPRVALNGGSIEGQEQIYMHAPSVKPVGLSKLYKSL